MARLKIPRQQRYRKRVGGFARIDVKHDDSVLALETAAECYNFDFTSGALRSGVGVEYCDYVPRNSTRYWVYRYYSETSGEYVEQYIYQNKHGLAMVYDYDTKKTTYISGLPLPDMRAINYRLNSKDVLLLSVTGRRLLTWDGKLLKEYADSPVISSMALHYERLFVTSSQEPTKVFFSDDLDPTNWSIGTDSGGFIELLDERGMLNKVVSFGNYLYIFRDHGISRVTAFGDQSEFSVLNLFVTAGRIYPSSIATCGTCIIFLASDGLYAFDGYDCARILQNLDGLIEPSSATESAFCNGKYYLSCRMNFKDGKTVGCESGEFNCNGLLVYNVANGEYTVARGLDISYLEPCTLNNGGDFLMCCESGKGGIISSDGKRFGEALPAHWQSPVTDFGLPDRNKAIREIYVDTDTPLTVTFDSGRKKKTVNIKPTNTRARVNFNCKSMAVAVDGSGGECCIKAPTIIYSS